MKGKERMRHKVVLSAGSAILTMITLIVLVGILIYMLCNPEKGTAYEVSLISYCVILCAALIASLYYVPLYVEVDDGCVKVGRLFGGKRFTLADVESVDLFQPTMGAIRLCGSGGFMGYWGWFKERDTGKYFAYYGKSSDCFMLKMKDGRKYVLGCADPEMIVDEIRQKIG